MMPVAIATWETEPDEISRGPGKRNTMTSDAGRPRSVTGLTSFALANETTVVAVLFAVGLLVRIVLVTASPGTVDVEVWAGHAREIERLGLVAYYRGGEFIFNHPPLAGWSIAGLHRIAEQGGPPFPFLLRAPFVLVDAATAWGVVTLAGLATRPGLRAHRVLIGALYWISPLSIVFSAHHGNTDSAVACSLVWSVVAFARGRPGWAGVALGLGLWIKIPGLLAAPALFLVLPDLEARIRFAGALGATALVGFAPALLVDAGALFGAVFGYSGLRIQTTSGGLVFGPQVFYPDLASLDLPARRAFITFANAWYRADGAVVAVLILVWSWLRRRERTPEALAGTLAQAYALVYAFTNFFAFQYLAWSLPFWLFAGWPLAIVAHVLCSAYIWGLYAWLCEHWLLLDTWRFVAKPDWPGWILFLRSACVAFLMGLGLTRLLQAGREEGRFVRARLGGGAEGAE